MTLVPPERGWAVVRVLEYDSFEGIIFYSLLRPGKIKVRNLFLEHINIPQTVIPENVCLLKFENGKLWFREDNRAEEKIFQIKEIKDYEELE